MVNCPLGPSIQYAAFADCPAGSIAARSFSETPNTRAVPPVASRSSSPSVVARRFRGDDPMRNFGASLGAFGWFAGIELAGTSTSM